MFWVKFVVIPVSVTLALSLFLWRVIKKFELVEKACEEVAEKKEVIRRQSLIPAGKDIADGKDGKVDDEANHEPKKEK